MVKLNIILEIILQHVVAKGFEIPLIRLKRMNSPGPSPFSQLMGNHQSERTVMGSNVDHHKSGAELCFNPTQKVRFDVSYVIAVDGHLTPGRPKSQFAAMNAVVSGNFPDK